MTEQLLYADPDTGEIKPFNTMMPPAIAAAIVAVKKDVKQIGADDQNKFGGYAYVSVDKIYDKIGRLMAANGLALMIDEIASEIRGGEAREGGKAPSPWLFVRYSLAFVHESGAMATPCIAPSPCRSTGRRPTAPPSPTSRSNSCGKSLRSRPARRMPMRLSSGKALPL